METIYYAVGGEVTQINVWYRRPGRSTPWGSGFGVRTPEDPNHAEVGVDGEVSDSIETQSLTSGIGGGKGATPSLPVVGASADSAVRQEDSKGNSDSAKHISGGKKSPKVSSSFDAEEWYRTVARPVLLYNIEFLMKSCCTKLGIKDLRSADPVRLAINPAVVTDTLAGRVQCKCRYDKLTAVQGLVFEGQGFLHTGVVFTVRLSPAPRCGVLSAPV